MMSAIYAGGFIEFRVNNIIGISPELYYSRQGFHNKEIGIFQTEGTIMNRNYLFDYINIPVLVKLYVANGLSLDLGPQ